MSTFIWSDPHFGHARIIELCGRPFSDVDEMNDTLAKNYREVVGPTDMVYWLGDCAFYDKGKEVVASLPGHRILVRGNHDMRLSMNQLSKMGFSLVMDQARLVIAEQTCRLSHYPYARQAIDPKDKSVELWPNRVKGEFLLHGHTHQKTKFQDRSIHVGVDAWDFAPIPLSSIAKIIEAQSGKEHGI